MTNDQRVLLRLAKATVTRQDAQLSDLPPPDWKEVFIAASNARMECILYDIATGLAPLHQPPAEVLNIWKRIALVRVLPQMAANNKAIALLQQVNDAGLSWAVFKGPVLANLYANPHHRVSSDMDILFSEQDRAAIDTLMKEAGLVYYEETSKHFVPVYHVPTPQGLVVEAHFYLWEDYVGERIDRLREMQLEVPESRVQVDTFFGKVVTLGHTEHLIYQMFHLIKHLRYKGIRLHHFTDIALFVNRYIDEIDVARFWQSMEALRYASFCEKMLRACEVYLGMTPRIFLYGAEAACEQESEIFMDTMFRHFFYDPSSRGANAAASFLFSTHLKEEENVQETPPRHGRFSAALQLMLPPAKSLTDRYGYAKRRPVLLPIAWVHRAARTLFRHKDGGAGAGEVKKSLDVATGRAAFLKKHDLLD